MFIFANPDFSNFFILFFMPPPSIFFLEFVSHKVNNRRPVYLFFLKSKRLWHEQLGSRGRVSATPSACVLAWMAPGACPV